MTKTLLYMATTWLPHGYHMTLMVDSLDSQGTPKGVPWLALGLESRKSQERHAMGDGPAQSHGGDPHRCGGKQSGPPTASGQGTQPGDAGYVLVTCW